MLRNQATALLTVMLLVPSLAATAQDSTEQDWPDFLGPQRNGRSPLVGIRTEWPLPIVWQTKLGTSYSAPTIVGERLFHYDRHEAQVRLTCRNAETGDVIWTKSHGTRYTDMLGYNNGPRCSPVVSGTHVFTMSAEGLLQCRSTNDGELVWESDTSQDFGVVKNFFGVGSTPVVVDDLLIANIGGSPPGQPDDVYAAGGRVQPNGSGVVAFDKQTGEVRWKSGDELASYASPVVATIDSTPMALVFGRGGLVAVEIASGKIAFEKPWRASLLESVNASTPTVVGNRVFISESYERGSLVLECTRNGCEELWSDAERRRDKAMELHWNTAVYHDGHLYGSSGRHSGAAELRCVEFATGQVKWSRRGLARCSLTYVDGHLICLGEDGVVRLLKATADAYTELVRMEPTDDDGFPLLTEPAWVAPVIARGKLYLRGSDRLVCFELSEATK